MQKSENVPTTSIIEDLGVSVEKENLSDDQLEKVKDVLSDWSHIFF